MSQERKQKAKELVERISKDRGFSSPWRILLAERDPEFLELYHKTMMHVWERGVLPRKYKEIIVICLDTILQYGEGLRIHVRNALEAGATEDEILEALELCSFLSIHNITDYLPAVVEEVESYKRGKRQTGS